MKNFLLVIIVVLLFIVSGMVFWASFSPKTFVEFFQPFPLIGVTVNKIGIINNQADLLFNATSSEAILNSNGSVIIKGITWNVEVANNEAMRTSGLSNRRALYGNKGMLFAFDNMAYQSFWMKDMLFPIDMIFFDENWKIVLIESDLWPNTFPGIFGDKIMSKYILEVNALEASTYGLEVGDQAIFINK